MWILSCDTDLLGGKCIWLRPGSQHLLGRTSGSRENSQQLQYIDHKSISRKHLTIKVDPLEPGASKHLHIRSKITLEDSSKSGTFVNDEKLSKDKREVDKTDTKIQLGSSNYVFHITWRPVVLTFTNLTSSQKKQADPLEEYRAVLEHADIKLFNTYISGVTTHVVATGRNNPSCLQALAQGKWLVQYSWIDTLAKIVEIESMEVTSTPLESDFAAAWPSETQAMVPSGTEPTPRPDETLMPDSRRSEVFSGLTFVFESEKQHDTLMPAIAAGGGKVFLCEVIALQTDASTFAGSIKAHFSTKKSGPAMIDDLNEVVIVRAEPKEDKEWWVAFNDAVEATYGRRCISQSEFLDAILMLDAAALCQPIERKSATPTTQQRQDAQSSNQTNGATQKSNRTRRYAAQSRFKGFDDFDPSQVIRIASASPEPMQDSKEHVERMDEDKEEPVRASRKRQLVPDISDVLERQLGGQNTPKRQRLATAAAAAVPEPVESKDPVPSRAKHQLPDVKAKLAEQRKKEEEAERQRQAETLDHQLEGLTVEDMQRFVQYDEFDIVIPEQTPVEQENDASRPGWDPAWNGRKNFKAFRARGQPQQNEDTRQQRVMVALEPLPMKTDAFFDEYFLDRSTRPAHESVNASNTEVGSRQDDSLGLSSYGTSLGQRASTQPRTGQKRVLKEQSTNGTVSKRPRRDQVISLDDDSDDELQFRRKRF